MVSCVERFWFVPAISLHAGAGADQPAGHALPVHATQRCAKGLCYSMAVRYATLRFPQLEAVVVPELSHLTDVVVLPAVGDRSTASEMGGGDYDGGTLL